MNTIYKFTLPKKEKETSFNDIIFNHIAKNVKWFKKEQPKVTYAFTAKTATFDHINPFTSSCFTLYTPKVSKKIDWDKVNLYKELYDTIDKIKEEEREYDFELFGEPVKIYSNFIQIGYKLIPYRQEKFFDNIDEDTRKSILRIIHFVD